MGHSSVLVRQEILTACEVEELSDYVFYRGQSPCARFARRRLSTSRWWARAGTCWCKLSKRAHRTAPPAEDRGAETVNLSNRGEPCGDVYVCRISKFPAAFCYQGRVRGQPTSTSHCAVSAERIHHETAARAQRSRCPAALLQACPDVVVQLPKQFSQTLPVLEMRGTVECSAEGPATLRPSGSESSRWFKPAAGDKRARADAEAGSGIFHI